MRRLLTCAALLCIVLAPSCRPRHAGIVVGSKNFTEQVVLGELLAQAIEHRTGMKVQRRFYLAGTFICHQALLTERIDMYAEYTGTALTAVLKLPPASDHDAVYERVRQEYERRFNLTVAPRLGFENSFAIAVRREDAERLKLRSISDLAAHAGSLHMAVGYEFLERPDGYQGLVKTYGLKFAEPPRVMDLGLIYRALKEKQVDVVVGSTTDGLIQAMHLVVLEDDQHYFPPYDAVPIARAAALEKYPAVREVLWSLQGKVSADDMRRMNYAVDGQHRDASEVVAEFLREKGL